ncbi:DNA topoisomerase 2-associated protein Pat1p [Monosporozyma servazzii]
MSFFGFDSSMPPNKAQQRPSGNKNTSNNGETLDFEETYKGYGEYDQEDGDYLNEETFGGNLELGNDFDFGNGSDQQQQQQPFQDQAHRSYVQAASSGVEPSNLDTPVDLKPMESLWSGNTNTPSPAPIQMPPQGQHILSMEEIERQQRQLQQFNDVPTVPIVAPNHPNPQFMPPQGFMQGQFPGQFIPQKFPNMYPPHPGQFYQQGPMAVPSPPPHVQQQQIPPQQNLPPSPQDQTVKANNSHLPPSMLEHELRNSPQQILRHSQSPMPPIHSEMVPPTQNSNQIPIQNQQQQQPPVQHRQQQQQPQQHRQQIPQQQQQQQQGRREPLSPEEQKRLQIRHAKVEKILKHAGLMTPRDKDFITRYQLSQIVTEDPYNEDFYFQVYKIIQRGGIVGESNKGLIARAYLEHSGHRLGGRYKRADIALQRMQSQVEKAVTVAKERPQKKNDDSLNVGNATGRDGVLGKVSVSMNSKAPRRQLTIPLSTSRSGSTLTDEDGELRRNSTAGALQEVTESLGNVELNSKTRARRRSSYAFTSIDQNSVLSRSGGRKFVLSLIETVYEEVLELEANLRSGKEINNMDLWSALHIDDEVYEVSPFISMLSFDKGVKIMPRIFNFLDKEQKLKLLQTFFSELSHLNIIIISSYKTNPTPTDAQLKKIDLFQTVFLKIIVSFLSNSSNFIEIMSLLLHLIKNNNVSFISTSKIGLNLITVLISRAALIRQDSNRSTVLSTPEISTWNEIYDKLFTALESKIANVFPPKEYIDTIIDVSQPKNISPVTHYYDEAYIWQFLASLALSGKLNHQRIIIDEVRDEIFGTINQAEALKEHLQQQQANSDPNVSIINTDEIMYRREKLYQDLNLFLNVMGLVSRDGEISELK